jgi:PASTA domain/Abnormal spindle-like microcephaly-assoc'd, ASPM-SPD-2-Hydin
VGLRVGTVTQQSSETAPTGSVISQSPTAGTSVAIASSVNLIVSSGPGSAAAYVLSSTSIAFGSTALNFATKATTVTLANTGGAALPIASIALTGTNSGQFSRTHNCGSSVAAGSTCTISVTFKPTSTGLKSASVTVTAGDGAGTKLVTLSGTGVRSAFSVSPTSLAFGNVAKGRTSLNKTVTITNTGTVVLPLTSITLAGTNPYQFTQTNNCPAQVPVGGKCTSSVAFKPTYTGVKSANLTVTPGGGASAKSVALNGTGI